MDRGERIGLGVAGVGHLILFGLLSVGFLATSDPVEFKQTPIEVSLVPDVALEAAAPASVAPPAQSRAPDVGEPEDAAPPAPAEAPAPEPAPAPVPVPAPAPAPAPAPRPVPRPAPKPAPAPRPVPRPRPRPKPAPPAPERAAPPAPERAAPRPARPTRTAPATAPTTAKPTRTASPSASTPTRPTRTASAATKPATPRGTGSTATATTARPRGSRLGDNFLKGLTSEPSTSRAEAPPRAAKIDGRALASIVQAIARQIQPCADRQVDPGPGANQIVTTLNLKLNENGTLAATPTVVRQTGVDDDNSRYARRVVDLGIAAFKGCSPLKLPPEFYSTPNGGWNNINYQWKLR